MKSLSPTIFLFFLTSFLISMPAAFAGNGRSSRPDYISKYKDDAVRDMQKTGVPASITLAQALLESDDGNSPLAKDANNHFGVKCANNWTGATYHQDDDHPNECFRKYKSVLESYDDHSNFLRTRSRYASLFQLDVTDYKGWAKGLKKAGYATNPQYADRLIKIIEENRLYELDKGNSLPVEIYAGGKPQTTVNEPVASTQNKAIIEKRIHKIMVPGTEVVNISNNHEILRNNSVPYIVGRSADTYKKIADEFGMAVWQLYKYNEIDGNKTISEGQKIYIRPKKREASTTFCIVKEGETLHDIAQQHGIKLRLLKKWNHLDDSAETRAGQKLWLKKVRS